MEAFSCHWYPALPIGPAGMGRRWTNTARVCWVTCRILSNCRARLVVSARETGEELTLYPSIPRLVIVELHPRRGGGGGKARFVRDSH